jgi:hypothetical protein
MTEISSLNIFQRILGVMSELHYIQKGDRTVNGAYRFVSHDQVTAAIHPLLVKYRIVTVPTIEEMIQDGNRTTVKLVTTFINVDDPKDQFSMRSVAHGIDGGGTNKDGKVIPVGDKGPGKAVSYAFKMACLKLFCLETGEDPDNNADAYYEPPKCQEFDTVIMTPFMTEKDKTKLKKFLAHSSYALKKHVEDVKREAVARPEDFLKALSNWNPKKQEEE